MDLKIFGRYITWVMILHGIEYQRPTSLNMRIMADHVTYSFLAFMKSIFHFCLGCYCGGYSQNGRSNLSSFFMMTSSNGNIFHVTGHLCGEFTTQRPVTWSFDVSFDLRLNKRLSKQSWSWWFETPSHPLWHHCNVISLWNLNALPLKQSQIIYFSYQISLYDN